MTKYFFLNISNNTGKKHAKYWEKKQKINIPMPFSQPYC